MPLRLRNPLRGPWKPMPLAKRVTDFILTLVAMVFLATNRRVFTYLAMRYAGLRDVRRLPNAPRRLALGSCTLGTACLYIGVVLFFASDWNALLAFVGAFGCYVLTARTLSRAGWQGGRVFTGHGYLAGVARRAWRVIRYGAP